MRLISSSTSLLKIDLRVTMQETREGGSVDRAPIRGNPDVIHFCTSATAILHLQQITSLLVWPHEINQTPCIIRRVRNKWKQQIIFFIGRRREGGPGDDEKPSARGKHRQEVQEQPWQESPELPRGLRQQGPCTRKPCRGPGPLISCVAPLLRCSSGPAALLPTCLLRRSEEWWCRLVSNWDRWVIYAVYSHTQTSEIDDDAN